MNELRVKNHKDWEEICKDLARYYVNDVFKKDIVFTSYGRNGEKQHGVDLLPVNNASPSIVCQCKDVQKLNVEHIKAELNKTDEYPHNIDIYLIFTTAPKSTSSQDYFQAKKNWHSRPGGEVFRVGIVHWEDLDPFKVLPRQTLETYFPNVGRRLIQSDNTRIQYQDSLRALKEIIPQFITEKDLLWLESWDFNYGYVRAEDYEPFFILKEKYDRAWFVVNDGVEDFLRHKGVLGIVETLAAGERFYDALKRFHNSINSHAIGSYLLDGTRILEVNGLGHFSYKLISEMKSAAAELANTYREDILGQSLQ